MNRKSSKSAIKVFLLIIIPTIICNLIASLFGIPIGKKFFSIHELQYDVIWIITFTVVFFALGLHKKD